MLFILSLKTLLFARGLNFCSDYLVEQKDSLIKKKSLNSTLMKLKSNCNTHIVELFMK